MTSAKELITTLNLQKHPEGGYYKRVYTSKDIITPPERFNGKRLAVTSIYYLLEGNDFSAFHRIKSNETWHFYMGSSLTLYVIDEQAKIKTIKLGNLTVDKDSVFQTTIPGDLWFAAEVTDKSSFALIGCTVAPGFEFEDFELATYDSLVKQYPQHASIIKKFTFSKK